jgi:hypothetical protein
MAISAESLKGVIVSEDKKNVRAFGLRSFIGFQDNG